MDEYIELNTFLKLNQVAPTGGQAKNIIRSEQVKVNGKIETRNKRKITDGDIVEFEGKRFVVKLDDYRR